MNYRFNWTVIEKNIVPMLEGLGFGLVMAIIAITAGTIIGLILAFAAVSKYKVAKKAVQLFVTIFRNTPILILVYITYFGLPTIGIMIPKVPSFVITLALYSSAYMEEVFRAGLEAIPKGIIEAGQAIGLTSNTIRVKIELPIMFKKVLPSMGNYLISLFKDTSIASAITVGELTYLSKILTTQTFRVFEVWLTTGVLYVAACYLIAFLLRRLERRFV
ncbi:MAG: amino acid ABC transporter permease [Firmicutes bacterium]|nr:amino acid ABC transporter permease [Bacillota bacterium]MBR7147617.1 amino acid ABC transporter permease [Bacillota bacterium]